MDQPGGLFLDRFDHLRMAMAGGDHGDPGGEVQEPVAVGILDHGAFAPRRHQRDRSACRKVT